MKRILLACDGSENSLRAVRSAAAIAQEIPSMEQELLHVLDPITFTSPAARLSPDDLSRLCPDGAERALRPARRILEEAGVAYRVRCRVGAAAGEIAAQVRESACDGIIMGHGAWGRSPVR